jgi:hypothetical protein
MGIPIIKLIEVKQGRYGGSWIHPKVAIHLAQWISADFAVQVSNIIYKYATNDLTLVQDIVEKTNKDTNTVSNITLASNPDDLSVIMLQKTYERDDKDAKYTYEELQNKFKMIQYELEMSKKTIVEKDNKIDELMRKLNHISEQNNRILSKNDELLSKNNELNNNVEILINNNEILSNDVEVLINNNEILSNDVEVLNQNVDLITEKLDIATDDRVIRPMNDKDLQMFAMYTNANRREFRTIRRQKRSFNVAKKKLQQEGFNVEVLVLEPSPNPINLQIRIKENLNKVPGIIRLSCNSIDINPNIISEQQLINHIRRIDNEKKNI